MAIKSAPNSNFLLPKQEAGEWMALMDAMMKHLTWLAADLLAKGSAEQAFTSMEEAADIEAAIASRATGRRAAAISGAL